MAIVASVAITGGALANAKTSDAKVNYLQSQMRAEQTKRVELQKVQAQTAQQKKQLEDQTKQKDDQIKSLNDQLQAKLEQKREQEAAQPAAIVASAVAPSAQASSGGGDIPSIITKWANANGISASWAIGIARCESGFNLYAHNPSGATGLFQFMPSTFYGNGGSDIYSADDQARVATTMLAHGQAHQWVCKG